MAKNEENGVWRTVGGRRIFIKDGQDLATAMVESGKFKNLRSDYRKTKEEMSKKEAPEGEKFRQTLEESKEKYGTDNVDLINAGKEKEDRVSLKLSEKQIEAGNRLNENAEKGVREDIKSFLSGKEDYDGSREDFIRDLSNNWGVDKDKVEDILHEENSKSPRLFKNERQNQENNKDGFTQHTDMYGGTREYSKEQLNKMQENGVKPMEHSYTGGGWEGTKYDSKLTTKDIAKNISDYSKKEFPDVKLSRKTDYNGVDIHIMSSNKDLYASANDIDKMSDKQVSDTIRDSIGGYTRMDEWLNDNNRKSANGTFTTKDERDYLKSELNTYKNRKGDNVTGNEWYLSDYGKKVISGLNKEMNSYNYDDSDGMVDYFDTNFYGYVHIGKWDQPYEVSETKSTKSNSITNSLQQKAYKKYLKEHPNSKMTFEDFKK